MSQPSNTNPTKTLLDEIDRIAYFTSFLVILLLLVLYYILWQWKKKSGIDAPIDEGLIEFLISIITNIIPVFLGIIISYAVFRRIQSVKSEQDKKDLVMQISQETQQKFGEKIIEIQNSNNIDTLSSILQAINNSQKELEEKTDKVSQMIQNQEKNIYKEIQYVRQELHNNITDQNLGLLVDNTLRNISTIVGNSFSLIEQETVSDLRDVNSIQSNVTDVIRKQIDSSITALAIIDAGKRLQRETFLEQTRRVIKQQLKSEVNRVLNNPELAKNTEIVERLADQVADTLVEGIKKVPRDAL